MAAGDPYWNNVVLALHMDGTNGSTTFTDLKGNTVAPSGNAQISTAQSKFGGASALFDGAGDFLTIPTASAGTGGVLDLSKSAFTLECFYRTNSAVLDQQIFVIGEPVVANNLHIQMSMTHFGSSLGGKVRVAVVVGSLQSAVDSTFGLSTGVWYHLAFVVDSSVRLYIDGVLQGTSPSFAVSLNTAATHTARVGVLDGAGTARPVNGNIDDLRITKGIARYTANFTPPALAFPNAPAQISGTVKDSTGTLAPRAVRAYRKSDGALAGATVSHSTTGVFSIPALDASAHFALTHDSDADPYWPNVVLATHFDTDSVIDPYASSVVLGLHMEGTNAGTTFTDVTGKTMTANGNVVTSTNTARFGNTSAKFDGTTDWISTPDSADWAFGTNDFTIECWFYRTVASVPQSLVAHRISTDASNMWMMRLSSANVVNFAAISGGVTITNTSSTIAVTLNTWTHFAACRVSGAVKLYVNGVNSDTVTANLTSAYPDVPTSLTIGRGQSDADIEPFTGYIDDIRITKGVARYTANFTPPTAPFGSFKDLTGKDLMISGTPSINTTTKKYGDGSLALNGTLTHLEAPISTDLTFGSADFTIELYAYLASTATAGLIAMGTGNNQLLLYSNTSNLLLYASSTGSSWDVASAAVIKTSFTTAQWYHIVICRKGGVLMAFLDGVRVLNIAVATASLTPPLGAIFVGSQNATANTLNGYLDDLRITKGVARYLSDFTPPERAFPGAVGAGTANAQIFDDLIPI